MFRRRWWSGVARRLGPLCTGALLVPVQPFTQEVAHRTHGVGAGGLQDQPSSVGCLLDGGKQWWNSPTVVAGTVVATAAATSSVVSVSTVATTAATATTAGATAPTMAAAAGATAPTMTATGNFSVAAARGVLCGFFSSRG